MNWKFRLTILLIVGLPAFSGYPLTFFKAEVLAGITYGWAVYFLVANAVMLAVTGRRFFPNAIAIAALVAMPVVFVGAGVSYLIFLSGWTGASAPAVYSAHYVSLCITMLTVIPLALSMVAIIPFHDFEHSLLKKSNGVCRVEKFALMFLRVFNHIVFFVIPNILETMREESRYKKWAESSLKSSSTGALGGRLRLFTARFAGLIRNMIQVGVEGICSSIQFIPLWAVEISQLPDKSK
jgi:hypothetical protein